MVKTRSLLFLLVLMSLVVLGAGCSVLQQGGGGGGSSYFPCAVGNTWRYTSPDGSLMVMTVEGTADIRLLHPFPVFQLLSLVLREFRHQ